MSWRLSCFFFQAEDGIRDSSVTGVQTCALPIFLLGTDLVKPVDRLLAAYDDAQGVTAAFNRNVLLVLNRELGAAFDRSEERRVGKECGARGEAAEGEKRERGGGGIDATKTRKET